MKEAPRKSREVLNAGEREKLESMRAPALAVLESLGPELEQGAPVFFVGIDSSGRLPALLVEAIAARIQGGRAEQVRAHFIGGKSPNMEEAIEAMHIPKTGTVLLVDDTYVFGSTLDPIEEKFRALGYEVKVVVMYDGLRQLLSKHPDAHYGIQGDVSGVHKAYVLSGVRTERRGPYATALKAWDGITRKTLHKKVGAARETIDRMADEIVATYRAKKS